MAITRVASSAGGGSTDPEIVRDTIAAALVAGSNVTITPNDSADTITIASAGGGGGDVTSVNGQTGTVVLDADDLADGSLKVQMTTAERTKLGGVTAGATANSSDATLLARANHTGSQAISTVTNLQSTIDDVGVRFDALDGISDIGNAGAFLTVTPGGGNGTVKTITLNSANCTLSFNNPAVPTRAYALEFQVTQDATGGRTITWPSAVKWPGGVAPTLSTAAGAVDRFIFVTYSGGAVWYGDLIGKGYA